MTNHEIEDWVIGILDKIKDKKQLEDDRIELKSSWLDPKKAACQIAAHANASHGEPILWIIGVDEEKGIVGAEPKEVSDWYAQVSSCFDDGLSPNMKFLGIPYNDKVVFSLYFETDRAPFVIKSEGGGQITREVPWREGNSTRSAKRSELLKILSPLEKKPEIDLLKGRLCVRKSNVAYEWFFSLELYIMPKSTNLVIIPFHRCKVQLLKGLFNDDIEFGHIILSPPTFTKVTQEGIEEGNLSETIRGTEYEVIINAAGLIGLNANIKTDKLPDNTNVEVKIKISLLPAQSSDPIIIYVPMIPISTHEEQFLCEWKLENKNQNGKDT